MECRLASPGLETRVRVALEHIETRRIWSIRGNRIGGMIQFESRTASSSQSIRGLSKRQEDDRLRTHCRGIRRPVRYRRQVTTTWLRTKSVRSISQRPVTDTRQPVTGGQATTASHSIWGDACVLATRLSDLVDARSRDEAECRRVSVRSPARPTTAGRPGTPPL